MAKTNDKWEIKHLERDVVDLAPRTYPYFRHLGRNRRLGIRKLQNGTATWVGEFKVKGNAKQVRLGEVGPELGYDLALEKFNLWVKDLKGEGITVRRACEQYLKGRTAEIRDQGGKSARFNKAAGDRFSRLLALGNLADMELTAVKTEDLTSFRDALYEASRKKNRVTLHRDYLQMIAALRWAADQKHLDVPALNSKVKTPPKADRKRRKEFPRDSLLLMLEVAHPTVRAVCLGILYTGCRPGTEGILSAKAGDIRTDANTGITYFHGTHYKGKNEATEFACPLTDQAVAFFKHQAFGKLPGAPLFTSPDGSPWANNNRFNRWFKKALAAASLPHAWVPYMIRHTAITQWVNMGIPLLKIAKWTGTSAKEIEAHYYEDTTEDSRFLERLNTGGNQ